MAENNEAHYAEVIEAISEMTRTRGWKLFLESLQAAETEAYRLMTHTQSSAHQAAMGIGSTHTIRQLRDWPQRTINGYQQAIDSMKPTPINHMEDL